MLELQLVGGWAAFGKEEAVHGSLSNVISSLRIRCLPHYAAGVYREEEIGRLVPVRCETILGNNHPHELLGRISPMIRPIFMRAGRFSCRESAAMEQERMQTVPEKVGGEREEHARTARTECVSNRRGLPDFLSEAREPGHCRLRGCYHRFVISQMMTRNTTSVRMLSVCTRETAPDASSLFAAAVLILRIGP